MDIKPRFSPNIPFHAPVVANVDGPSQSVMEPAAYPLQKPEPESKRSKLAAVGCLGAMAISSGSTTVGLVAPEAFVTTTAGLTSSAPVLSTVDGVRGQPINTTLRELMGVVKEQYLEGYRGLKKAL